MAEKIRVLIQMQHSPEIGAAAARSLSVSASVPSLKVPGFSLDESYTPTRVPRREPREQVGAREVGRLFSFDSRPEVSTYLIRGEVEDDVALNRLIAAVDHDPRGVGVFADPRISAIAVCPSAPVGTHEDVENLLEGGRLRGRGMDGANVRVVVVDTGVNLGHLRERGKNPRFDAGNSWTPVAGMVPGNMPVDHGTMCAFDVCIAAPNCTLLDYALLQSRAEGETVMEGFLSDAVTAFSRLLDLMINSPDPRPALVVNTGGQ